MNCFITHEVKYFLERSKIFALFRRLFVDGNLCYFTNNKALEYLMSAEKEWVTHNCYGKLLSFCQSTTDRSAKCWDLETHSSYAHCFEEEPILFDYFLKGKNYVDIFTFNQICPDFFDFFEKNKMLIAQVINYIKENLYVSEKDLIQTKLTFKLGVRGRYKHLDYEDESVAFYLKGRKTKFSKREMQVLRLLAKGQSVKDIALAYCLSPRTIEKYVSALKGKTALNRAPALADFYWENFYML
jgi:DNA-binding CsgD family transcriptional regulator